MNHSHCIPSVAPAAAAVQAEAPLPEPEIPQQQQQLAQGHRSNRVSGMVASASTEEVVDFLFGADCAGPSRAEINQSVRFGVFDLSYYFHGLCIHDLQGDPMVLPWRWCLSAAAVYMPEHSCQFSATTSYSGI